MKKQILFLVFTLALLVPNLYGQSCTVPSYLAVQSLGDTEVMLKWNAVNGSTAYQIQVEDLNDLFEFEEIVTDNMAIVSNLTISNLKRDWNEEKG